MFQFSCRFAFYQLFVFQTRHQKTQILTVYQANAASLTLFSKGDKSQSHGTVRQISRKAGDPSIISFADYSQSSASQAATRKGALNSWLKRTACTRYFRYAVWETIRDNRQTYMKTETCKLYSSALWIFLLNIIKIDLYNFELYRFKVGSFFETQCSN